MAQHLNFETLFQRNRNYALTHEPIPTGAELKSQGFEVPQRNRTLIITCSDPRNVPERYLKLQAQDGVLVMRNACGHPIPLLNDILAVDVSLILAQIIIIHHTDCGATHFTDAKVRTSLTRRLPEMEGDINNMSFGAIIEQVIEQSVRDDVALLKASPFIRQELKDHVLGFKFDIKTGLITPVQG